MVEEGIIESAWRKELGPSVESLIKWARVSFESKKFNQAEAFYRVLLARTTPPINGVERVAHGEACVFYARKALAKKRMGEAGDWFIEALASDPLAVDYRIEFTLKALVPMGLMEAARQEATRATRVAPDNPQAWHVLGAIEFEIGNTKEAKAAYDREFALAPYDVLSYLDLITWYIDTTDYDKALELCKVVEEKFPEKMADIHHCRAMVAYRTCKFEEAIDLYTKAIEAKCFDFETARWNRSLPLQAIGRWKEGWADAEARGIQTASAEFGIALRRFNRPLLDLQEHKPPARVHLHEEMGFGDTIAMLRYIPLLVDMGYEITVELRESIMGLVQRSFPGVKVIQRAVDYPGALGIPDFDYHHSLLSMPYVFGTEVDTIPWSGPYLRADLDLVEHYKDKLPKGRKIGLCWSAGIRKGVWLTTYGLRKSLKAEQFRPLLSSNAAFVSLQVGPERKEAENIYGIYDILPEDPSWDDTAAVIENLDLVITADTAVSHLAGAMGKPTYVLWSESANSWHYLADVDGAPWQRQSVWYPNTRVFRQKEPYKWYTVIQDVLDYIALR